MKLEKIGIFSNFLSKWFPAYLWMLLIVDIYDIIISLSNSPLSAPIIRVAVYGYSISDYIQFIVYLTVVLSSICFMVFSWPKKRTYIVLPIYVLLYQVWVVFGTIYFINRQIGINPTVSVWSTIDSMGWISQIYEFGLLAITVVMLGIYYSSKKIIKS
jgi:hypothetical protein